VDVEGGIKRQRRRGSQARRVERTGLSNNWGYICSRECAERCDLSDGDFTENAISLIMKRKYSAVEVASRVAGNPPGDKRSGPCRHIN
jgi:hypothetical protein